MSGILPRTASNAIAVCVVLPTCGRMDLLDRCLDALTRQSLAGMFYEIIVVDDQPSHNTLHLVAGWRARTLDRGLRLVYLPNTGRHGPAAARNLGWRNAQAAIIAFTDEQAIPAPGWLAQGLAAFTDEVDVLCGRLEPPSPPRTASASAGTRSSGAAPPGSLPGFHAANCFCRKSMLAQLDGFDERFEHAPHGDADFHFRLLAQPARIAYAPAAMVALPTAPARWGASLARTRDAVFDALLYKKHPQLYRERIAAAPPWEHYLAAGALLLMLGTVLGGATTLATGAALAWLALTARLCWQGLRGSKPGAARVAEVLLTSALIPPLSVFWRLAGALRYRVRLP